MTDPTAAKFPLADLSPDSKTAAYIGVLERTTMYQSQQLLQYRALLEALTGERWEEIDTRMSTEGLKKTAATAFERRLGREMRDAEKIVEANMAAANEEVQ